MSFDILMLNYQLTGLNALDIVKIIKQKRELSLSIIIITGHGSEEIAVQALKIGADEYLVKSKNYLSPLPSLLTNSFQRLELEKQQTALRESEAKYRLLADNSGDMIFTLDLDFNYTYVSPAVKEIRGFTPEEMLTKNFSEVITPKSLKSINTLIDKLNKQLQKGTYVKIEPQLLELEKLRKDGTTIWTEVKASILTDENNVPVGILGVSRDISKRKKAMEELHKLSRAIEQSSASIIITDIEGKIEYINPNFTKVTGYSAEEVMGQKPNILKSGMMASEVYSDLWNKITTGKVWNGELENKKKDGTILWEQVSVSPITNQDGETTHYLAIKEDITQKKAFEKELIIARDKAQESDRLKSAFLATMSHELRTPLNAIIGFSEMADDNSEKNELLEYLKTINASGNHLLNIIEDIFTLSLLQTKQTNINNKEFLFSDFFESLKQDTCHQLKNKGKEHLTVNFQPIDNEEIIFFTDKTKLYQILTNFIKNAIKFTNEGSIDVGFYIEDRTITFFAKDSGIGISNDKTQIIFERFRQIEDATTRKHDGVGLGLAICSEIATLLNGKIWVESEIGVGSTFYSTIPDIIINQKINLKSKNTGTQHIDFSNKTILIVEDEDTNFLLMKSILSKTNVTIKWAKTGEESIYIYKSHPHIDLVLMDIRLPGIDGFNASRQIKNINPEAKIIAQTAFALENDKKKILDSGFDNYISKPIKINDFIKLLSKYLLPN